MKRSRYGILGETLLSKFPRKKKKKTQAEKSPCGCKQSSVNCRAVGKEQEMTLWGWCYSQGLVGTGLGNHRECQISTASGLKGNTGVTEGY